MHSGRCQYGKSCLSCQYQLARESKQMKIDYIEQSSNHDIALDFYCTLMHHKVDKGLDHIDLVAVIEYLKHHYETDQTPIAVKIRNQNNNGTCES